MTNLLKDAAALETGVPNLESWQHLSASFQYMEINLETRHNSLCAALHHTNSSVRVQTTPTCQYRFGKLGKGTSKDYPNYAPKLNGCHRCNEERAIAGMFRAPVLEAMIQSKANLVTSAVRPKGPGYHLATKLSMTCGSSKRSPSPRLCLSSGSGAVRSARLCCCAAESRLP